MSGIDPWQYPMATNATRLAHIEFDDLTQPLNIDGIIQSLRSNDSRRVRLQDCWSRMNPILFARRALEVSVWEADQAIEERAKAHWISELEHGIALAENAMQTIGKLNSFLANSRMTGVEPTLDAVAKPIRTLSARWMPRTSIADRHQWAEDAARSLITSQEFASHLAKQLTLDRKSISGTRKNTEGIEKRAFVRIWAEAWVALVGRLPGKGVARNPFLDLVNAAWADVQGPRDQSFASALNDWLKSKESQEGSLNAGLPSWS